MLVYQDLLSGDELLSDSFHYTEIDSGILWEVQGKWVAQDLDPSVAVDDAQVGVVDIVDTFRLQQQPSFEVGALYAYLKKYVHNLTPKLKDDRRVEFQENVEDAVRYLLGMVKDLLYFVGKSMLNESALVFAYYKEGKTDPTFIYFADGLKKIRR